MSQDVDPSEFVQRIRQLGEQRDQQDAERVRKLEEEILQGRSERLARRAERARSLSPDKPTTPQSLRSLGGTPRSVAEKAAETPTPVMEPPTRKSAEEDVSPDRASGLPPHTLEEFEPKKPAPSPSALSRSGSVLGWQQRKKSTSGPRRPFSMMAPSPEKPTFETPASPEPSSPAAQTLSREQIAKSLGGKDPSWFRQTPDRGIGSAAYRKNQEDSTSDMGSVSGRRQLPGLSRESTAEPETASPLPDSTRPSSPSVRGSTAWNNQFSASTPISAAETEARIRSPLPTLESQKFQPPSEHGSSVHGGDVSPTGRSLPMSPSQGRISPERGDRPPSPTKGMGGFVQSAMLKRSDSVNKRWSVRDAPSISRQNSTASSRGGSLSGFNIPPTIAAKPDSRPSSLSREPSKEPGSRPGSSSSNTTITRGGEGMQKTEFVRPALPAHSRSKSVASLYSENNETSPSSPPKRWSPTKSSWLENALNRPDSPKFQAPQNDTTPAWMAELTRKRLQRGSVDLGKEPSAAPADSVLSGRVSPEKPADPRPSVLKPSLMQDKPEPKKRDDGMSFSAPSPVQRASELRAVDTPATPAVTTPSTLVDATKPEDLAEVPLTKPIVPSKPSTPAKEPPKEETDAVLGASAASETVDPPKPSSVPGVSLELKKPATKALVSSSPFLKESAMPSATKPKPETPPKKDFRSALRPRPAVESDSKKEEVNELQNVFGRLRKAETKNYVAPDELKSNILRGKSALNTTGGPKPSNRKNEFRESLISQKAAMLAKAQETGSAVHKRTESTASQSPPEAIAKRQTLGRTGSISSVPPPSTDKDTTPEAIARRKSLRAATRPVVLEQTAKAEPPSSIKESVRSSKLADRFNPALAVVLARGPSALPTTAGATEDSPATRKIGMSSNVEKETRPGPELTHVTKNRARGPKRRAPGAKLSTTQQQPPATDSSDVDSGLQSVLTIGKEKDSSRELPGNVEKSEEPSEPHTLSDTPSKPSVKEKPLTPIKSPDLLKKMEKPSSPELPRKPSLQDMRKKSSNLEMAQRPARTQVAEEKRDAEQTPKPEAKRISKPLPTPTVANDAPRAPVEKPHAGKPVDNKTSTTPQSAAAGFSVKKVTALWDRQSASPPPSKPKPPIKLPTRAEEQAAKESAGLDQHQASKEPFKPATEAPKLKPVGLGLGSLGGLGGFTSSRASRESSPPKPVSATSFPTSPPASGGRPQSEPFKSPSKTKEADELAAFFDEAPVITGDLPKHIDTLSILTSSPIQQTSAGKIRTTRKQIQEISGDGHLAALPMQEEHILFQDSMYICTHLFQVGGLKHTEVYLWAGNGVPDATLEDVQLFVRNIAKQNRSDLLILRQGKESPNFLEALGGIVITRRGARPASKQFLLCGRHHLGSLVFDEVDFSLDSLCSGFVYVATAENGKAFLWKGVGCTAEEFSGARLAAGDLTATGELVEMDESSETPDFFDIFPPNTPSAKSQQRKSVPRSAYHWRHKPSCGNYRSRLFRIDQLQESTGWGQTLQVSSFFARFPRRPSWQGTGTTERSTESRPQTPGTPKSPQMTTKVVEIAPFCQRDLEPEHIYVLDAFFEMYIIVGALASSQSTAFSTAMLFAQEYSMLSTTEENRPMIPPVTCLLQGYPKDLKANFRHWDDRLIPAAALIKGKLNRGGSIRVMRLDDAIRAVRKTSGDALR